jgi:hypothetical protein
MLDATCRQPMNRRLSSGRFRHEFRTWFPSRIASVAFPAQLSKNIFAQSPTLEQRCICTRQKTVVEAHLGAARPAGYRLVGTGAASKA